MRELIKLVNLANGVSVIHGISDQALKSRVESSVGFTGPSLGSVHIAPSLNGDTRIRLIDVFRDLAMATQPRYQGNPFGHYMHWARWRYAGLFDRDSLGQLILSTSGISVVGNMRRVVSEDMGVGFGVYFAKRWAGSMDPDYEFPMRWILI